MNVETVCTHDDLAEEVGGAAALANPIPAEFNGSSEVFRRKALEDVLTALGRRTPPLFEESIGDPSELRRAVTYGALERLYRAAMTGPDSVWSEQRKIYEGRFKAEMQGLQITTSDSSRAPAGIGIVMERR